MSMPSETSPLLTGQARYADGKTAGSTMATVTLTERGIAIDTGSWEPLIWPYGALETAVPLSQSRSHDALVTYRHQPGATLFLEDQQLIAGLIRQAGHLSTSAQRWRWARPVIVGVVIASAIAGVVSLSDLRPAATIAGWIPQQTRETLGRQVVASMTAKYKRCVTRDGTAALERLVDRLKRGAAGTTFDVRVVNWGLVNAFAAPGGQIVVTRGLISKAGGPDEVAAVIAHEMGHGIKLHPESGIVRSLGLSALIELMMGGGGGTLSNIGILMAELSYSREAEREADAVAVDLLRASAIPAQGLASFFERIEELKAERKMRDEAAGKDRGWGRSLEILSTHPLTEERIAAARRVAPYPATPALDESDWQALRSICSALEGGTAPGSRG
ncbi:MAG: M48 family metallopeptidase [Hyphomicrobiaceae bacterium]